MANTVKVSANPNEVEFPRDPYQMTQKLRAVGLTTSTRVGTQKDKLKVLIDTLDVLRAHAIESYKKRQGMERQSQEAAAARAAREAEVNRTRQLAEIAQLEAQLASVRGEVEDQEPEAE